MFYPFLELIVVRIRGNEADAGKKHKIGQLNCKTEFAFLNSHDI